MVKRILMLVIAAAALLPFCWEPAQSMVYNLEVDDRLYRLVELAGAEPEQIIVQGWTKVNSEFMDVRSLEDIAVDAAARLGSEGPLDINKGDGNDFRQVRLQALLNNETVISIAAQSLVNYSQPDGGAETYMTVSIAKRINSANHDHWTHKVRAVLENTGGEVPQVLTNFIGTIPGKLSTGERDKILTTLFNAADAHAVETVNTGELCSATGFTQEIHSSLEIGRREVNLNIALRYHNLDGQTYIYIGSPLLIGEY